MNRLLDELMHVHSRLASRENFSSLLVGQCASVEKDYISSLAATLLTLGGVHGPTEQVVNFLEDDNKGNDWVTSQIERSLLVPGWGSDFYKREPDPTFVLLSSYLCEDNPRVWAKIERTTSHFHALGKKLFPNAACYTAAVAITEGIPAEVSPYLLIKGRLEAWTAIYLRNKTTRLP